jgi:hypothetical protein
MTELGSPIKLIGFKPRKLQTLVPFSLTSSKNGQRYAGEDIEEASSPLSLITPRRELTSETSGRILKTSDSLAMQSGAIKSSS